MTLEPAGSGAASAADAVGMFWANFNPKQWERDVRVALHAIRNAMRDAPAPAVQPAQPAAPSMGSCRNKFNE